MENGSDLAGTLRVLVVNHNSIFREGVRLFVETQPNVMLVGSVADADAAVDLFAETRPDLTLADLNLPSGRGIDAIRRIREIDPGAWIIGLVTYEWDDRVEEAIGAGASAVLSKDLIADKLMPLIRTRPPACQPAGLVAKSRTRWRTFMGALHLRGDSNA